MKTERYIKLGGKSCQSHSRETEGKEIWDELNQNTFYVLENCEFQKCWKINKNTTPWCPRSHTLAPGRL